MNNLNIRHIILVSRFTFIEVARSKLMVSIPILGFMLMFVAYIASSFAYGAPGRVAVDVGLGLMSISNLFFAVFIGATLVSKEVDSRTIYMIISKPLSRSSFILGKILGFLLVVMINAFVLVVISQLVFRFFNGQFNQLVWWIGLMSLMESTILLLIAVFFSLFTNVSLTVIFSILVWILGSVLNETQKLIFVKNNALLEGLTKIVGIIMPDFSKFNLKDFVLYQQNVEVTYLLQTTLYFVLYALFLCLLNDYLFKKKDFN